MRRGLVVVASLLVTGAGCRRANQVGDHVLVDWRGADYPAVIVGIEGPDKFRVHFDGYSNDWDETLPAPRVKARLDATPNALVPRGPPARGSPQPNASASSSAPAAPSAAPAPSSMYHLGDRVRVEWHGSIYPAAIIDVAPAGRFRVHYEGFGNEWDETIGVQRIQRKNN